LKLFEFVCFFYCRCSRSRGELGKDEYFAYGRIDASLETVSAWVKGPVEAIEVEDAKGIKKRQLKLGDNSYEGVCICLLLLPSVVVIVVVIVVV
jgi:hypothetical protein